MLSWAIGTLSVHLLCGGVPSTATPEAFPGDALYDRKVQEEVCSYLSSAGRGRQLKDVVLLVLLLDSIYDVCVDFSFQGLHIVLPGPQPSNKGYSHDT